MVHKICWNCRQKGHEWWGCTEPVDQQNFALSRKLFAARDPHGRARRNYKAEAFFTRHPEQPRPPNCIQSNNAQGQRNPLLNEINQQVTISQTIQMATSSFQEGEGETQDSLTFSADKPGGDSDSSSSSTSTLEANYPGLKGLMERISVKEDPEADLIAEKKQLDKRIDKFGVKKEKYYREMEAMEKMVNELAEEENKLKEEHETLASMKAARLSEARKKVTELESEISGLKGKIEDVNAASRIYNETHKAIMEEISHTLMRAEPLFRLGASTMIIRYTNFCAGMEKSVKDLASSD